MMAPSWFVPITSKWAVMVPIVVKGLLIVILDGFHRMARPPEALVEYVVMELHSCHTRFEIVSTSVPRHLVSWSSNISGLSAMMHSHSIRCLDLPFSPRIFHVMIFTIKRWVLSGGIPPIACVFDRSLS
jgi:hypothetical protein